MSAGWGFFLWWASATSLLLGRYCTRLDASARPPKCGHNLTDSEPHPTFLRTNRKAGDESLLRQSIGAPFRENLFFFKYPNAEGTYLIDSTGVRIIDSLHGAVYHTLQDDGTAGDSYYIIEGIVDNWLKITKKEEDELWGEFQVAFVKDLKYGEQDPAAPDTVIFTKGNFHTRLSQ